MLRHRRHHRVAATAAASSSARAGITRAAGRREGRPTAPPGRARRRDPGGRPARRGRAQRRRPGRPRPHRPLTAATRARRFCGHPGPAAVPGPARPGRSLPCRAPRRAPGEPAAGDGFRTRRRGPRGGKLVYGIERRRETAAARVTDCSESPACLLGGRARCPRPAARRRPGRRSGHPDRRAAGRGARAVRGVPVALGRPGRLRPHPRLRGAGVRAEPHHRQHELPRGHGHCRSSSPSPPSWPPVLRQRRERQLAQVRKVAAVTQRALLRPLPPRLGRVTISSMYLAADEEAAIGGDLYAAAVTERDATRVLIGDVQGKGLAAVEVAGLLLSGVPPRGARPYPAVRPCPASSTGACARTWWTSRRTTTRTAPGTPTRAGPRAAAGRDAPPDGAGPTAPRCPRRASWSGS